MASTASKLFRLALLPPDSPDRARLQRECSAALEDEVVAQYDGLAAAGQMGAKQLSVHYENAHRRWADEQRRRR